MHRMIMNTPSHLVVDHINGERLDNRKCNLRNVLPEHNHWNRKFKKNKHDYPGISKQKSGRYSASIKEGKKIKWLGTFDTKEQAFKAYLSAWNKRNDQIEPL
jgi:hypothetical protein